MENWYFNDDPNSMVLTTKNIIYKNEEITFVSHDIEDGMWQFLDRTELTEDDAAIISLKEIVNIDLSLNKISCLPLGKTAHRRNKNDDWEIE